MCWISMFLLYSIGFAQDVLQINRFFIFHTWISPILENILS